MYFFYFLISRCTVKLKPNTYHVSTTPFSLEIMKVIWTDKITNKKLVMTIVEISDDHLLFLTFPINTLDLLSFTYVY
ncbi:hypothetical protein BRADI_2g54711v3 [Brachypodium distachyon]|uniref:Uncharacterized protein n=1 Tax=Brachypodium distachyon TaxID=15368 RepID=A0A0Q3KHA8_BRADI|nr:hypothetical protein BRADI_2g54711v3 [Brachypodium distachyon]